MRRDTHLPNGRATLGGLVHDDAAGANLALTYAAQGHGLRRRGRRSARLRPLRPAAPLPPWQSPSAATACCS
jgi:hypothetical protein